VLFKVFNNLTNFIAKNFVINSLFSFVDLFFIKYIILIKYKINNIDIILSQEFNFVLFN